MPFMIVPSQKSLSDLLRTYQTEVERWRMPTTNADYPVATQNRYQGYVYVLETTIEELTNLIADNQEEDRKTAIQSLAVFWQQVLDEWESEETQENYQLGRIRMLTIVIRNLEDLESYE